ncbi:MAG: hypothetical protein GY928_11565, partial [Colwellia sp.]|nr:hypothetical protein [Colwellia sp.]
MNQQLFGRDLRLWSVAEGLQASGGVAQEVYCISQWYPGNTEWRVFQQILTDNNTHEIWLYKKIWGTALNIFRARTKKRDRWAVCDAYGHYICRASKWPQEP